MNNMLGRGNKASYCLTLCMVSHGVWQVFGYRGCTCVGIRSACAKLWLVARVAPWHIAWRGF